MKLNKIKIIGHIILALGVVLFVISKNKIFLIFSLGLQVAYLNFELERVYTRTENPNLFEKLNSYQGIVSMIVLLLLDVYYFGLK